MMVGSFGVDPQCSRVLETSELIFRMDLGRLLIALS